MNAMKQSLLERAPRLLATVLLCGLTSATRAMARGNPIAMPVRVWGYGNSNYYQGEPGELDLSGSFMPTTPGGTDGDLYLIGTKSGTGTFYTANPGNQMALMEPGKSYSLGVDAFSVTSVTFCISPPPGYTVEINGVNRGSYTVSVSSPWSYSNTFTIRLLGPMNSMTGRAGAASSFTNGRVHWRAALGSLRNGRSAGSLAIVDAGRDPTWSSVYTPASLQYETPSAEVTVYRSSGNIRQILANEACVDVVTTNSTTYHLDFYSVDQVSGSGFPHTFTGQPYVKYTVTQDGSGNKLKITSETRSITSATDTTTGVARTAVTTLERTGTWPAFTWTMNDWNDSGQTQLVEDYRTWSANGSNAHAETTTVLKPGDSTNATYATKAYTHYDWGEELTNETNGSAGSNPTTTTYDFNTSSSAFGSYGFVNSASTTGGGWTACEYSTASSPSSNYIGVVKRIHRPFNDSPSSVPGTLSTNTSGEITAYDYTTDSFGMRTRPTSIQTKVNNVVTASAAISYGNETANSKAVVVATRQDQSDSAGNYLTTVTRYYREDVADDFFRNQIHSVTQPDGTKQSCAYQRGTWASGSFTTGSGSCTRAAVINGTTNSSGNATCSSLNGYTVDTVYLVSNRSTMDVTIRDAKGHVVHTETDVWDGNAWQQTAYVDYTYNICNQLTNRSARNGAQYDATYSGELKNSETDEAGVQTTYAYDYAGRVDTATKVGYSATPISIGDLVTKYLYDAASRVTEVHWGYGQTEQMIAYSAYDDAGRVTSETPAGLGATTYTYNPSDRARTATIPDGNNSTRVETYQPDGRLASITGTAVVPSYYSYSVAGDGTLTTQVFSGTSNSSRWSKTTTDWLGRKITTDQPGFSVSSQADCTIQYAYNTTTGQLLTVTPTNTAPTRYAYSSLGLISSTGLDLDNNGLGASSGDRMADQEHFFENDGTDWWLRDETYVYATAGSSTRTLVGVTRQRLTGFPANRLAETKTTDADGNITTRTVDVARSSKTLTNTTASSGQTQTQTETVVDGLSLSLVTFQNLTITTGYDGLQRPNTSTDPRTGKTTTNYRSGTTLCSSVVTPDSYTIMSYDYDNLGRTLWSEDHDGKFVRYAYNARGQLQYQWGEACTPVEYGYDSTYGDRTTMKTYRNGSGWSSTTWAGTTPGTADTTSWNYDTPSALLHTKTDNSSHAVTFDYNARRQVATRTWASGVVTTYAYEDSSGYQTGELKQISYSDGTPTVEFHRDDNNSVIDRRGLIRRVVDATGTRQFYYRAADAQLDYESLPSSFYGANGSSVPRALTESYDASGMVGRSSGYKLGFGQNDSTNMSVGYGYESDKGRLQTVTMSGTVGSNSISGITYTYTYTSNSNLIATVSNSSFTRTNTWNSTRDLPDEVDTTWSGSDRARFDYSYDCMGRRQSEKLRGTLANDLGYAYGYYDWHNFSDRSEVKGVNRQDLNSSYDPNGTYETAKQRDWVYDDQGNRKTETRTGINPDTATYSPTGLNQYSSVSGFFSATFGYDDNGNLTDDGIWWYYYDGENRLSTMVKQDNSQRLEFVYDYLGRRVQKIVRSGPYSNSTITLQRKYVYEGWNMIAELDNSGTPAVVRNFLWGLDLSGSIQGAGGVGGLLQMQDSGSRYFAVQNAMGNIRGLLNTSGSFVARYDYTPFGDLLTSSGSLAGDNPFRFSSKYTDGETGLVYYGFRYYSPAVGRFINRDPIEEAGGLNLYGFCGNDPQQGFDARGLWPTVWYLPVHQNSINRVLWFLPPEELKRFGFAQSVIDTGIGQAPALSFLHAMTPAFGDKAMSRIESDMFINMAFDIAKEAYLAGDSLIGDILRGFAFHTGQDGTPPPHGDFAFWYGSDHLPSAIDHVLKELYDPGSNSPLDKTTLLMYFFSLLRADSRPEDYFGLIAGLLGKSDNFDYIREKSKYTPAEQAEMVKQVQQTIIDLFQHANDMINAEHDRRAMFFALLTVDENDSLTIDAAAHPSHSKMDSFLRKALEDTAFARAGLRDKEWADAYADWADYYWMRYQMAANELASVQENQATIQGKLR